MGPMSESTRPEIDCVKAGNTTYIVGVSECSKITFGEMKGSMDMMPTIQIWNGDRLAAEFNAAHATCIIYKTGQW